MYQHVFIIVGKTPDGGSRECILLVAYQHRSVLQRNFTSHSSSVELSGEVHTVLKGGDEAYPSTACSLTCF